jgi:hypothetical protein
MTFDLKVSSTELWRGCVLATIAHAIFTAHHPELTNEQSWDGVNYNVQDSEGSLGTVTFAPGGTVGAFFDSHSRRNPISSKQSYDLATRLTEMPAEMKAIAENDTLQYLLQDHEGAQVPIVTAAFWTVDDHLVAAEPWPDVFANGAHLIQTQLKSTDEAIDTWRNHYGLSTRQVESLRSLFATKISVPDAAITLSETEKAALLEQGSEGLEQSRELLAELNIVVSS